MLQLTFNPGLTLTGFRTTQPCPQCGPVFDFMTPGVALISWKSRQGANPPENERVPTGMSVHNGRGSIRANLLDIVMACQKKTSRNVELSSTCILYPSFGQSYIRFSDYNFTDGS